MVSSSSLACGVSDDSTCWVMLMSVLLSVRPALTFRQWSFVLRRDQQLISVANPEEERSPDSYPHGTPSGRYVGGTLVFTQVRPRPPEKFPNTLDFDGYGRAHRTLSRSGARARALIGGADSSTAGRS